jgi:small neutral amino acid transporter SnatA (MarC family)
MTIDALRRWFGTRFFAIRSREQAAKIVRRASYYFILTALVLLALQGFAIHDEWRAARPDAPVTASLSSVLTFCRFLFARLVTEDWVYVLMLANGIVLRRFESRIAAALFVIFGLYGMGLSLFVLWAIGSDALLVSGGLAVFFASIAWIAARAFVAAKKLRGEFAEPPAAG